MTEPPQPQPQPPGMLSFAIGEYTRAGFTNLPEVKDELVRVQTLFGGLCVEGDDWDVAMGRRGMEEVSKRLEDWSLNRDGRDTVLYWIGHGEQANGLSRLLTSDSAVFMWPFNLVQALGARGNDPSRDFWTFAVIDTCHSTKFVKQAGRELPDPTARTTPNTHGVLLFGVSGDGRTRLGRFGTALAQALEFDLRGKEIHIRDLAAALKELLPGSDYTEPSPLTGKALLVRRGPWLPVRGPLDMMDELDAALRGLAPDRLKAFTERAQHARDAQYGDVTWHFRGHHHEQREVVAWLRESGQGMLVVTGQPGAGKSAFLGHLLVQSQPALREALDTARLIVGAPADKRPEDNVFTAALTLRNLSTAAAVTAIADACRLGGSPSPRDLRRPAQWLMNRVRTGRRELTLLLDGLDEAQDPLRLADGVLRELAALPGVRLLVGTRPSTAEEDPGPAGSSAPDILEALGVESPPTSASMSPSPGGGSPDAGHGKVVTLTAERDYVEGYVRDRLAAAPGEDPPGLGGEISATILRSDWSFLVARLAVHEILAHRHGPTAGNATRETEQQPEQRTEQLARLLSEADPRQLFAAAVARLRNAVPAHEDMLRALAYAQGAGLPPTGDVWATVVAALTGAQAPNRAELKVFARTAAPYVSLDDDQGVTVYRLAHNTFREHFLSEDGDVSVRAGHARIVRALLDGVPAGTGEPLYPYLSRYLSGHAAAAGMEGWRLLAARTDVLDRLDARALGTDAVRGLLGSDDAPEELTGVIGARHQLVHAHPRDRRGIREIAMARQAGTVEFPEPRSTALDPQAWTVHRAWLRQQDPHTTMEGRGRTTFNPLAAYPHRGGVDLLAAGDAQGAVRVWRPTGERVHVLPGPQVKEVRAVLPLTGPGGQTLLAVGGRGDEIRLWHVRGLHAKVLPPFEHPGGVRSMTALTHGGRTLLASGGDDGVVRLRDPWDPEAREPLRIFSTVPEPRQAGRSRYQGSQERRWVRAMTTYTEPVAPGPVPGQPGQGPGRRTLLVTAHPDHLRVWDPFADGAAKLLREWPTGHRRISTVKNFTGPGGRPLLASCGEDGTVRIWDPATGRRTRPDLTGHTGGVNDLAVFAGPDDRTMLASVGDDNTLRLWDPHTAGQVGNPWTTGHRYGIRALRVFTGPEQRTMLATAGRDGRVKTWDPVHPSVRYDSTQRHRGSVHAVTWYRSERNTIGFATASGDRTARLWNPAGSGPSKILPHPRGVRSVTAVPGGQVQSLATACTDGNIYIWNPDPASHGGPARIKAKLGLTALISLPGAGKRQALLAGAYGRKVRLWNPVSHNVLRPELSPDHDRPITAMTWFREPVGKKVMLVTADRGRMLRVWDTHSRTLRAGPFRLPFRAESLCAFEAKGRSLIAVGGRDGAIRVIDPDTGAEEHLLNGHSLPVTAIDWAGDGPEGPRLISGSRDGKLRVWDPLRSAPSLVVPIGVAVHGLCVANGRVAIACTEGLVIINLPALRELRSAH
ncbi:hypothetical protein [Streptomyces sp. NPDC004528]|uniref:hypothetical protein n=1 Tax=Streptomyces sp. NPDC004528 TaxID=3154550 RepID=UPI0033AFC617